MASDLVRRLRRQATRRVAPGLTVNDVRSRPPEPVGTVMSTTQNRVAGVSRNGLSLEDLMRDEMRPLIKEWLDRHLPPLVERLVQAELERLSADALI